jgi:hypothetical protein
MVRLTQISGILVATTLWWVSARAEETEVQATFLGPGTFATEAACKSARDIEAGAHDRDTSWPRFFTAKGSKLADEICTYTSIMPRAAGYHVTMACRGGCESTTAKLTFTPHEKGGFAVSAGDGDKKQRLVPCEPPAAKPAETN